MEARASSEPTYNQLKAQNADPAIATFSKLPAILVNGQQVKDVSFDGLSEAIEAALALAEATPEPAGASAP